MDKGCTIWQTYLKQMNTNFACNIQIAIRHMKCFNRKQEIVEQHVLDIQDIFIFIEHTDWALQAILCPKKCLYQHYWRGQVIFNKNQTSATSIILLKLHVWDISISFVLVWHWINAVLSASPVRNRIYACEKKLLQCLGSSGSCR